MYVLVLSFCFTSVSLRSLVIRRPLHSLLVTNKFLPIVRLSFKYTCRLFKINLVLNFFPKNFFVSLLRWLQRSGLEIDESPHSWVALVFHPPPTTFPPTNNRSSRTYIFLLVLISIGNDQLMSLSINHPYHI